MNGTVISLIIPTFNEEKAIGPVLKGVAQFKVKFEDQFSQKVEVIVVDDGSSDQSVREIKKFSWVELIEHRRNQGYGAAIKTGALKARGQWVAFMDMDATYEPQDLIVFYETITREKLDMVVGNRRLIQDSMPPLRRLGNWFFSELVSLVHQRKIKDCCSGIRLIEAEKLKNFLPTLSDRLDFALDITLRMLKDGDSFAELPTTYRERLGSSKLSHVSDGWRFLITILRKSGKLKT